MSSYDPMTIWKNLQRDDFNQFECLSLLKNTTNSIGLQYALVSKLRSLAYDEIEFLIPQLLQLLISFESDSMALEDLLQEYCTQYPHFSLIMFWYLQAYIFELRNEPDSTSFRSVRRFVNKLQAIMFNTEPSSSKTSEFLENLAPALALCGAFAAVSANPRFSALALPLIKSQGKQQRSFVFKLANFQKTLTKNITLKNKKSSRCRMESGELEGGSEPLTIKLKGSQENNGNDSKNKPTSFSDDSDFITTDDESIHSNPEERAVTRSMSRTRLAYKKYGEMEQSLQVNMQIKSKKSMNLAESFEKNSIGSLSGNSSYQNNFHSLPDLSKVNEQILRPLLLSKNSAHSVHSTNSREHPEDSNLGNTQIGVRSSYQDIAKFLRANYAKKETEFIMALQNISLRLSQVPKEARLSALRAELTIINKTLLPDEIDIPQLLPVTSNKNKRYHKVLKLNVNEACVLNSAERVPFLLYVEFLSDESDFNPLSERNQEIVKMRRAVVDSRFRRLPSDVGITGGSDETCPVSHNGEAIVDVTLQLETDLSEMSISSPGCGSDKKSRETPGSDDLIKYLNKSAPTLPTDDATSLADQMRIAAVMLQQLECSGKSASEQSIAIKNRIVESMIALKDQFDSIDYDKLSQLRGDIPDAGQRKLENDFKLGEDWEEKKKRIRKSSIYGHLPNWDLCSVIAKNGDDLPQEAFASQLISMIANVWKKNLVRAWTKRMKILITSANTGLVETITNAISIHSIKKSLAEKSSLKGEVPGAQVFTLEDYFITMHGPKDSAKYHIAQDNFARSLASYSIICYVLQIKDRHNGNIMIDNEGHIVHIDFGFLLSNSPGSVGFEAAPFKLTQEYIDLMGGVDSPHYATFVDLCKSCFNCLRKESELLICVVELMQKDSNLPCFTNGANTSVLLRARLQMALTDEESDLFVQNHLIGKSIRSVYTRLYDQFQAITQGIHS